MKKILLILSVFIASCGVNPKEIPINFQYVTDLTNKVCVKYPIVDKEKFLVGEPEELPLLPGGPCDRMIGASRDEFKTFQNWIRDIISNSKKQSIQLP